jgi:hypothetical protein
MALRRSKSDGHARTTAVSTSPPLPDSFPKQWPVYEELYGKLTDDEWAAHCFLAGYDQQFSATGNSIARDPYTYLEPLFVRVSFLRGELEAFGREALLRVLRGTEPLSILLRRDLADLFDQTDKTEERKVLVKFRSRVRNRDSTSKPRAIANFIQEKMRAGEKWPEAVELARKEFGKNGRCAARSTITTAWAADRKQYPKYHARPVRPDRRSRRT